MKRLFRATSGRLFLLILFACLIEISTGLRAQSPYFRQVRTPEAMREAVINCLYQSADGFLWIGTTNGLFRYDGRSFQEFRSNDPVGLPQVSALYSDPSGRLWAGTRTGKIYRLEGDSLVAFVPKEGLPEKAITGFATDKSGNLWFSTYGEGLYYYNNRYLYNLNTDDGLSDDFCYGILSDEFGRIWTGTDEGISVCYANEKMKKVDVITQENGLPDNIVLKLKKGRNGIVWAGMQDGGFCSISSSNLKVNVPEQAKQWSYGPVKDLMIYNDILWLSSEEKGILEVRPGSQAPPVSFNSGEKFTFSRVNHLLADNQGNAWLATNSELIFSAGPGYSRIHTIGTFHPGEIHAILAARSGQVYFSQENALYRFLPSDPTGKNFTRYNLSFRRHTHIISLYEDTSGYIWAGTFGEGVYRINPLTGKARLITEKDGLGNGNILSINGTGNEIWFATLGGAYRCTFNGNPDLDDVRLTFGNFSQENGPGNNYIYKVYVDSRKRIWFGTDGKGVSVYENGKFRSFGPKDGIPSKVVYSIVEDRSGSLWFTSSGEGAYRYDGKTFRNYTLKDGLSDLQISCLGADRNYHVFFAYDRGIDILDIRTGTFTYYGAEQELENTGPDLNVISGSGTSQIWLGTRDGLIRLEPDLNSKPQHPALKLQKVSVFLGKENFLDTHELSYSQNHLSFFFSATWFSNPDLVTYQIKLEGYDLDWINTRDNLATYSSLPPGKYRFLVRAALKGNYNSAEQVAYSFVILKPYWKTWWFITGIIFLIATAAILFIRIRDLRFQQREASEREKLLFQFQTLRSQVNPHFLFNSFSTLMSVIDENKDLAIEYVQMLSRFFRNILEYRDKDLITLGEELKLIDTYRYLQQQRYGENFRMEISIRQQETETLIPPLVLQMLVENAIKHNVISEDKPLEVKIFTDRAHIIIQNNLQRKKLVESSTGLGLENIRNRYNLLGNYEVQIREDAASFTVELPIINP